jgi:hypothetical protein
MYFMIDGEAMERKDNGFFQIEMLIALALATLFLTSFAKHFMLASAQDLSMRKRTMVLDDAIDLIERSDGKFDIKGFNVKTITVEPDNFAVQNLQLHCGKAVRFPRCFAVREIEVKWKGVDGRNNRIVLVCNV